MRKTNYSGNFFICLLLNIVLNLDELIPAAVLLLLHFVLDISIWWAIGAFILWILWLILWMFFVGWASKAGSEPDPPKENKNPYSVGNKHN